MLYDLDLEDRIEIGTSSIERAGRSVFVNADDRSKVIGRCVPKRSQDGGYSHSRVVLSRTAQPSHKTLTSRPRASLACLPTVESSCWQSSHSQKFV